jgi:hypothetical protein
MCFSKQRAPESGVFRGHGRRLNDEELKACFVSYRSTRKMPKSLKHKIPTISAYYRRLSLSSVYG